jgi:hypothetical protein
VAIGDRQVEVLEDPDAPVPAEGPRIAGQRDEVERVRSGDGAGEIRDEDEGAVQDADEERLAAGVVAFDLRAKLADAARDLLGREVDLADGPPGRPVLGVRGRGGGKIS